MMALVLFTLASASAFPVYAATTINVTIGMRAPGQYGRIDTSHYPSPVLVMPSPVVYAPSPVATFQRPIYLYVPQAQQQNWGRFCKGYGACGQPVYFVRESWVREAYDREHGHDRYPKAGKPHQQPKPHQHGKHAKDKNKHDR